MDESDLLPDDFEERYKYTSIVRSQLSKYELVLLFYNCATTCGNEKFKPLVEKYALLKNLDKELLAHNGHDDLFNKSAYTKQSQTSNLIF